MASALAPRNLDALASLTWAWSLDFVPRIVSAAIVLCLGIFLAQMGRSRGCSSAPRGDEAGRNQLPPQALLN